MSSEPTPVVEPATESPTSAAETAYLMVGLAAVVGLGVALLQTGSERWSVVPTLIGAAGLTFRWRSAPLVLLISVALTQLAPFWLAGGLFFRQRSPLAVEISLSAAVLLYIVVQYRLFGLVGPIYPRDPHRRLEEPPARSAVRFSSAEVLMALVMVTAATVAAFFLWQVVTATPTAWNIRRGAWQVGLLAWIVGGTIILTASVIGRIGWGRLSRDEADLYLRDVLWRETRGEQRRIQRWRAWALRRQERRS